MSECTKELTKENLFNRAKNIFTEVITLENDVDALIDEFTYDEDENPSGIDKKEVRAVVKAAEVHARNNVEKVEEKIAREQEFLELYRDLSGEYD